MAFESTKITSGGKDRRSTAATLLAPVFAVDPVITYMLCSMSKSQRLAYLPDYFHILLKAAALNGATFHEASAWEACSVLMPPGKRVDNPWTLLPAGFLGCLWNMGLGGCKMLPSSGGSADQDAAAPFLHVRCGSKGIVGEVLRACRILPSHVLRMLFEYTPLSNAAKSKALRKGEVYFYVFFVGTREDCRGKGLASSLMRHYQAIATTAQLPIWLEATTAHSQHIYAKLGFETVAEIVLGEGKAASDGTMADKGPGIKIWGMIWRPGKIEHSPMDIAEQRSS